MSRSSYGSLGPGGLPELSPSPPRAGNHRKQHSHTRSSGYGQRPTRGSSHNDYVSRSRYSTASPYSSSSKAGHRSSGGRSYSGTSSSGRHTRSTSTSRRVPEGRGGMPKRFVPNVPKAQPARMSNAITRSHLTGTGSILSPRNGGGGGGHSRRHQIKSRQDHHHVKSSSYGRDVRNRYGQIPRRHLPGADMSNDHNDDSRITKGPGSLPTESTSTDGSYENTMEADTPQFAGSGGGGGGEVELKLAVDKPLGRLLSATVIRSIDHTEPVEDIDAEMSGKLVALYFSAHWAPPCRRFNTRLKQVFAQMQREKCPFEVIFISLDSSMFEFQYFYSQMPWLAVRFPMNVTGMAMSRNLRLRDELCVPSIPCVVIVDAESGTVITKDARADIEKITLTPSSHKSDSIQARLEAENEDVITASQMIETWREQYKHVVARRERFRKPFS